MDDRKCCGTCKYHRRDQKYGDWVCVNVDSDSCGDWTEYGDNEECFDWEERD